jgi:FkbM family methyltransferase
MDAEIPSGVRRFTVQGRAFRMAGAGRDDLYFRQIRGRFEPGFQAVCARALGPGGVAVDVGANIGATALIMSAFVGAQGRVVAMVPGPRSFALLQRNLALNGAGAVTPLALALSAEAGRTAFCEDSAFGHLAPGAQGLQEVEVETLDRIVERQGLTRLDLLKIDIEGFEPQVLEGARATIERLKPVIYMELNSWALIAHGRRDPLDFVAGLAAAFPWVLRVRRRGARTVLEKVEGSPDQIAAVLVSDNLAYFHALNDLVLLPDEAAAARFSGMIVPRVSPIPTGPMRLVRSIGRRLAGP